MDCLRVRARSRSRLSLIRPPVGPRASFELDLAVDRPAETHPGDRHRRLGGQLLVALEAAVGERLAHRLLDLALGGDAERLEEFADAGVEGVFVHGGLLDQLNGIKAAASRYER